MEVRVWASGQVKPVVLSGQLLPYLLLLQPLVVHELLVGQLFLVEPLVQVDGQVRHWLPLLVQILRLLLSYWRLLLICLRLHLQRLLLSDLYLGLLEVRGLVEHLLQGYVL